MNAEIFSEWLQRQGHKVFRTGSSYWYDAGPSTLQAFPYHWIISPGEKELNELMVKHSIAALRYSTPVDSAEGKISYHVVLHGPYTLEGLRSQARNGVRKGLTNFRVERIPFARLANEGWLLQKDTLDRQDRSGSMSQSEWQRICLSAEGLAGFETWAAVQGGELAAALLITRIDDVYQVPYAICHRKYLNLHVNNVLFFTVSCELLGREGVKEIFYSLDSLDAPESVNEFKFRMSFIPIPVRQRVVFHPWIRPLANQLTYAIVNRLHQSRPSHSTLAKAEGMLRFHLQGRRNLEQQTWPECLAEYRNRPVDNIPPDTAGWPGFVQ
jgi:hypothetical protein